MVYDGASSLQVLVDDVEVSGSPFTVSTTLAVINRYGPMMCATKILGSGSVRALNVDTFVLVREPDRMASS
jgi:hypothetical protein